MVKKGALLVWVVLLAAGFTIEPAGAATNVSMQALLNADGSGRLFVNEAREGWSWETCTADLASCSFFGTGRDISTGGAQPETVFRVSGGGDTGLSPIWHGNLTVLKPPSGRGTVRVNQLIEPAPAIWGGGWDGDFDHMQLAGCKTPAGTRCTPITDPSYPGGCRDGAAVIDRAFTGDYLRVADIRYGRGTAFTLQAVGSPYTQEAWGADGQTAVAMIGRIGQAIGRRTATCGPPPLIGATISDAGFVTVNCGLGCHAALIARHGRRRARATRTVPHPLSPRLVPPHGLSLSRHDVERLGPGRTRLVVRIDGERIARRTVVFG
jgi:hypothetical protein